MALATTSVREATWSFSYIFLPLTPAPGLLMCKHGHTVLCHTRMYQSHGIVVGAIHCVQFYKGETYAV